MVSYPTIPVAENIIFLAQWFATCTGPVATVAFPAALDFAVYFRQEHDTDVVVLRRVDAAGVSAAVRHCRALEQPENVAVLQVLTR
jgi:hypothetical protein